MKSVTTLALTVVVLTLLTTSFLRASTASSGGVLQAMEAAKSQLESLSRDLNAYPGNDVIVKDRGFWLNDTYRKGPLRQSSRTLDGFGGDAFRIGQEIQQICIDWQRDEKRLFDFGTDKDAETLRDRLKGKVSSCLAKVNAFIKDYKPEEAPVTTGDDDDDSTADGDDDDDSVVSGGAIVPDHGGVELIGTVNNKPIGQSKPDAEAGTTGVQHSYSTYTVKSGDSIWKIADRLSKAMGVPREKLMAAITKANYLGGKGYIYEGQELKVPVLTDVNGNKLTGATAETALDEWQKQYEDKRVFAGADGNTDEYAKDVTVELRLELKKAYDTFYELGSRFAQCKDADEEARTALIHDVRSKASTYVVWARRRYQMLKDQIRNMPKGQERDTASAYLKKLATVGRCADNLQYAKASGWRFDFCNQQVADLLGAAGVAYSS